MRIGLGLPPTGHHFEVYLQVARQAEERGFESLWFGEAWGTETSTLVTAFLATTQRIHVGTGIISLYLRPPTLTAMQAASMDLVAPGRARLGIGVSTRNINTFHGIAWDRPVARTREYVDIVRRVLAGERVTRTDGFYQPRGFRLSLRLSAAMPIYLAAVNPRMLQLAGEIADGVLLAWLPARQIPHSLAEIAKGAERAGRRLSDIDIGCYVHTLVKQDREQALRQLRHVLVGYCQANTYIQGFRRFGYSDVLDEVHARWQAGDRKGAEEAIPDSMVEELFVFGPPEDCRTQLGHFIDAGVQQPIVASPPTSQITGEDMHMLVEAFGQ